MTQTQLVRSLAGATGSSNKAAKGFLDALAHAAINATKKSGVFVLPGIGRLVRVDRKVRMGRNAGTGEAIKIPAKKVVKFRAAKAAQHAIRTSARRQRTQTAAWRSALERNLMAEGYSQDEARELVKLAGA